MLSINQPTLGLYKSLFKQTAIYGLATVLPRMLSFLLVGLYTDTLEKAEYGEISVLFAWMVFLNVILSYGMETAFFRFYNSESDKKNVIATSTISIFWSSALFLAAALIFRKEIAFLADIDVEYITLAIWILFLDALVIIPFSRLRVFQKPTVYTMIKVGNVAVNLGLNVFFLLFLPKLAADYPDSFIETLYVPGYEIGYVFVSNLVASLLTFVVLLPDYFRINWKWDRNLWNRMLIYAWPVLFAGIAFAINEHFDKILLEKLLPESVAKAEVGAYSACYKLALFMTLYATAFRLGIEPFFFSHAGNENAKQTYAVITKYFVIFGSVIFLGVIVFADILKVLLLRDTEYWEAMKVVPLVLLANFFLGIYTNLSVWYKLIDRTKMGAYISFSGAFITLALNFILIPYFQNSGGDGYMGSAIATIAAYGSMMALSYFLGAKHYPIPYDVNRIGGYLIVSTAFSFAAFYLFREIYYINIPLLLVFIYFIYHNEKQTLNKIISRKVRS